MQLLFCWCNINIISELEPAVLTDIQHGVWKHFFRSYTFLLCALCAFSIGGGQILKNNSFITACHRRVNIAAPSWINYNYRVWNLQTSLVEYGATYTTLFLFSRSMLCSSFTNINQKTFRQMDFTLPQTMR